MPSVVARSVVFSWSSECTRVVANGGLQLDDPFFLCHVGCEDEVLPAAYLYTFRTEVYVMEPLPS